MEENSTKFISCGSFGSLLLIGYVGYIGSVCLLSYRSDTAVTTKDIKTNTVWTDTRLVISIYGRYFRITNDNGLTVQATYIVGGTDII